MLIAKYSTQQENKDAGLHIKFKHIFHEHATSPAEKALMSVMHGQRDMRPTVTFPDAWHH